MGRETLPQNTLQPTTDTTHTRWRRSVLASPQTAGMPTTFNEDESGLGNMSEPSVGGGDPTGGAIDYHRLQRRK